jgi:hypothetical protein
MAVLLQATLQFAALPVIWSWVQVLPSSQLVGHEAIGSQVSPASTTSLPQLAEQSVSAAASQPGGQQPSPGEHAVMAVLLHATLQLAALPVIWSWVQALPSSQLAGHVVAGSQVSPASTMPLPQLAEQSESVAAAHVAGQQPSPPTQVVMALLLHTTLHASPLPVSWSSVQALPSSQLVGQEVAGSQVSPASTTALPQVAPGAGTPPVPESAPAPGAPPLLVPPPVPPPSIPAAPPLPDSTDESDVPHEAIVAAKPSAKTANEVFFIADSPSLVRVHAIHHHSDVTRTRSTQRCSERHGTSLRASTVPFRRGTVGVGPRGRGGYRHHETAD